jgi:hypothetical protein
VSHRDAATTPVQVSTPPHNTPHAMSVADAAGFSGLSTWVIRDLLSQGKVESRKYGRRVLVLRASLVDYIDNLPADR